MLAHLVARLRRGAVRASGPVVPSVSTVAVRLRDGTPALLRPLLPSDRDELARGLERMSPTSRYQRFHAPVDRFDDAQLRYLTEVDHQDHFAWALLVPEQGRWAGVAVARWVRLADRAGEAELAVTVVDDWQGRGVGGLLLGALGVAATVHDVWRLRCAVLAENRPMRALLERAGGSLRADGAGLLRGELLAAVAAARLPATVHQRLARLARGAPALARSAATAGVGG